MLIRSRIDCIGLSAVLYIWPVKHIALARPVFKNDQFSNVQGQAPRSAWALSCMYMGAWSCLEDGKLSPTLFYSPNLPGLRLLPIKS